MASYNLTLAGQPYVLSTEDQAEIDAITACRNRYNASIPQTVKDGEDDVPNPDLKATDTAYLQFVFGVWATSNPGFTEEQLLEVAANAFASYVTLNV